jgi:hypothetical protein
MLWFFEKEDARVHYEIRSQSDGFGLELVITREDGREQIEKYPDARAVSERSRLLHDSLIATGWRPPETPSRAGAGQIRIALLSTLNSRDRK